MREDEDEELKVGDSVCFVHDGYSHYKDGVVVKIDHVNRHINRYAVQYVDAGESRINHWQRGGLIRIDSDRDHQLAVEVLGEGYFA